MVMATKGEITREHILEVAETLVLEQGFSGTSIDDIIGKAGLTKGAFFYHFKDKGDLAQALAQRYWDMDFQRLGGFAERAQALADDPLQALFLFFKLFEEFIESLNAVPDGCLFASYVYESRQFAPAINDFIEQTKVRKTIAMGGGRAMAEFATVQSRLAEATAALDAAKLMILRDLGETHAVVDGGGSVDLDMRLRNRLTHAYAVKLALGAIDGLYSVSGIGGINTGNRIGRAWRDINAISHHISLNWDAGATRHGKYLLGLEPDGQF